MENSSSISESAACFPDYASLLQCDYLIAQSFYSCAVMLNQDDCFALFLKFFYYTFNLPAVFRAHPCKRLIKQDQFIVPDHTLPNSNSLRWPPLRVAAFLF